MASTCCQSESLLVSQSSIWFADAVLMKYTAQIITDHHWHTRRFIVVPVEQCGLNKSASKEKALTLHLREYLQENSLYVGSDKGYEYCRIHKYYDTDLGAVR